MDVSQLQGITSSSSADVQGMGGGHHHHHKSISDQVSQMSSAIDGAVQAGTMTSDQAASLKSELADITKTLGQNGQAAGTATTAQAGQGGQLSQLSDADRKKVFSELQDVRKQLGAAMGQGQGANASSGSNNAVSNVFAQIDTNGDGTIDQSEFTQFLAQVGANALGYNQQGTSASGSGSSFSVQG